MTIRKSISKLAIVGVVLGAVAAPAADAVAGGAKEGYFEGSSSGTFIRSYFRFDDQSWALLSTYSGETEAGGDFTGQTVTHYYFPGGNCYMSDGTEGYRFGAFPVQGQIAHANGALNFKDGQLFLRMNDADTGEGCQAEDGRYEITIVNDIVGGTGDFAGAQGELTSTVTGIVLAAPNFNGSWGQFGSFQETHTGTVYYD